jgi:hypothetical protein
MGKAQLVATNVTGGAGVSPDGTFWVLLGDSTSSSTSEGFGYFRCDDTEDGDLDPFVFFHISSIAFNNGNARVDGTSGTSFNAGSWAGGSSIFSSMIFKGWRRRGWATADAFMAYYAAHLVSSPGSSATSLMGDNPSNPETVACSYTTKRLRERVALTAQDNTAKGRKGTLRWWWEVQGNTPFDTFDGKTKIVVCANTGSVGCAVWGPYDGATTPSQT